MQSVWSTNASCNGVRSWNDQNYNGEGMLLCFYQSHGEVAHFGFLQRCKNVSLLKTIHLHCPQSSEFHRNFFQDLWRSQFLLQRMKHGKGCGPLYPHVLAVVDWNRLVWLHMWNLLPVHRFGGNMESNLLYFQRLSPSLLVMQTDLLLNWVKSWRTPLISNSMMLYLYILTFATHCYQIIFVHSKNFPFHRLFGPYSLDVVASSSFSVDADSINNPDDPFIINVKKIIQLNFWVLLVKGM